MSEASFYKVTASPPEKLLPGLLEKVLSSGKRAVVLTASEQRTQEIDNYLWTYTPLKFLPHGTEKDGQAERQPVFITHKEQNPNQAEVLVVVDGQLPGFANSFSRVVDMFNGNDNAANDAAGARAEQYKQRQFAVKMFRQNAEGAWENSAL